MLYETLRIYSQMQSYYIIEYDYSSVINHFLRVSTLSTDAWYMDV